MADRDEGSRFEANPIERVRDLIEANRNYFPELETAAENLRDELNVTGRAASETPRRHKSPHVDNFVDFLGKPTKTAPRVAPALAFQSRHDCRYAGIPAHSRSHQLRVRPGRQDTAVPRRPLRTGLFGQTGQ